MTCFHKVLVGIDLTKYRRLAPEELHDAARAAAAHAIWLAQKTGAQLRFFAALDLPENAFLHLTDDQRSHVGTTLNEQAGVVLRSLVEQARQAGVEASSGLSAGPGWLALIHEVQRGAHDLVVLGTSELTPLRRLLFGTTALKLLRHCPCPVWVTKPEHGARPLNILIATDLHATSTEPLWLGLHLGRLIGGTLHVLHVVEYKLDFLWGPALSDPDTAEYHRKVREAAWHTLDAQVRAVRADYQDAGVQLHLAADIGVPDVAIQHFIQEHAIDLLVMGTIARGGVPGIMIGNTAERLLPEARCSLLAVKPLDFQCAVAPETSTSP